MGIRIEVDNSNESVGKKIRSAEVMKVPVSIVIGEKEIETGQLTPRVRKDLIDESAPQSLSIEDFFAGISKAVKAHK